MKFLSYFKNLNTVLLTVLCLAFLIVGQTGAQAQTTTLNEASVKKFISDTTRITKPSASSKSSKKIKKFLERHLHKDSRFKSTMTFTIPGYPEQKNSISLDKKDYISSILDAPAAIEDYDNNIKIEDILISTDGRKATLKTKSKEIGMMKVSDTQEIPIEGHSTCNQILMLSKKDVIQMFSAQCTTKVEFLEF